MKLKEFDKICQEVLAPLLQLGFQFGRGMFFRETPSGVRHAIALDFNVRNGKTFRVMVGLNHKLLTPGTSPAAAGVFAMNYLGGGGLGNTPVNFPAHDSETAKQSLVHVLKLVNTSALPWFDKIVDTRDAALRAEDQYPFTKGKLFALAGCYKEAEVYLRKHLDYLSSRPQSDSVKQGIVETNHLLREVEAHLT